MVKLRHVLAIVFALCALFGFVYSSSASAVAVKQSTRQTNQLQMVEAKKNYKCLVCVAALLIVEQNLENGSTDIAKLLGASCDALPSSMQGICQDLLTDFGAKFIEWLAKKFPVDGICSKLHLCNKCHISEDRDTQYQGRMLSTVMMSQFNPVFRASLGLSTSSPEAPKIDLDKDGFSSMHLIHRGADWRGKDCNDLSSKVHPGVYDSINGPLVDHNCNGIYGVDENGKSYEEMYCNGTDVRSFVAFGDSVGAAFEVPAQWILMKNLSAVANAVIDELDWPTMAASSGWKPKVEGKSLYGQLRANNLCNHRDYQNLAKNGAKMVDLASEQIPAWIVPDKPSFVYIGYVGNDICHDTLEQMTKPEDFRKQFIDGLTSLSQKVKTHSYVVAFGLVDGRILWDAMSHEIHPLGIPYAQFYDFLSCTGANPCQTWLTSDEATRNAASARASELSKIMADVAANHHFDNLSVFYVDFEEIVEESLAELEHEGLPPSILISKFDGFHPSLFPGHRLIAEKIWDKVKTFHPEFIGNPNPNNEMIQDLFGDQGGY